MGGQELIGVAGVVLVVVGIVGFVIMYRRYSNAAPARPKQQRDALDAPSTRAEREAAGVAASAVAPAEAPSITGRSSGRPDLLGRRDAAPTPAAESSVPDDEADSAEPQVADETQVIDEPAALLAEEAPVDEPATVVDESESDIDEPAAVIEEEAPVIDEPVPEEPPAKPIVSLPRPDLLPPRPTVSLPRSDPAPARPPAIAPPSRPVAAGTPAPRLQSGTTLARYAAVGRKFNPSYPDPVTWGVLRAVMDEAESYFARSVRMRSTDDAALVDEELRRLIIDGYVLGRVERRSEAAPLGFGKASEDPDRDALRFIELVVQAAREGWQDGVFTGPIDPEIESIMSDFVDDAAKGIIEAGAEPADGKTEGIAIALSRACSLGREAAVIEATFLTPGVLRDGQSSLRGAASDRVGRELNYRDGDNLKIAEKALRIARDEFRRPNASLVRNERSI